MQSRLAVAPSIAPTVVQESTTEEWGMLPRLSAAALRWRSEAPVPSVIDAGTCTWLPSGRHAIALALRSYGVGAGSEVLVPAYHCVSMLEPVRWLGARPVTYRIDRHVRPDLVDLAGRCTSVTRAIIVFHPFGTILDLEELRKIARDARIAVLEDCAHAFFGFSGAHPVGTLGDVAIASPRKFFPTFDGGCLVSTRQVAAPAELRSLGLRYDVRSIWNTFEPRRRVRHGRTAPHPSADARQLADGSSTGTAAMPAPEEYRDERFAADSLGGEMSRFGRLVLQRCSVSYLVKRRRRNYDELHAALVGPHGVRPLHEKPGTENPGFVPYVFPLLLEGDFDRQHAQLKAHGVPVYRWERLAPSDCRVSREFERRLIQLPCHQGLSEVQIASLVARVRAAIC